MSLQSHLLNDNSWPARNCLYFSVSTSLDSDKRSLLVKSDFLLLNCCSHIDSYWHYFFFYHFCRPKHRPFSFMPSIVSINCKLHTFLNWLKFGVIWLKNWKKKNPGGNLNYSRYNCLLYVSDQTSSWSAALLSPALFPIRLTFKCVFPTVHAANPLSCPTAALFID